MSEQQKPKRGRKPKIDLTEVTQPKQETPEVTQQSSVELQSKEDIGESISFLDILKSYDEAYKVRARIPSTESTYLTKSISKIEEILKSEPHRMPEFSKHEQYWTQVWDSHQDLQSRVYTIASHIQDITK